MMTMTVSELVECLNCYPKDMLVVIDGYEGGVENVKPNNVGEVSLILNVNGDKSAAGPHEVADDYYRETYPDRVPVPAVLITRNELRS